MPVDFFTDSSQAPMRAYEVVYYLQTTRSPLYRFFMLRDVAQETKRKWLIKKRQSR